MTVNKRITDAITPFCPCSYGAYLGTATTYCYFIFPQDEVAIVGDDDSVMDLIPAQIHLFTPSNYLTLRKKIRRALKNAGFTYPNVTCLYETDTKLNHIIFDCEILDASEKEEV